MSGWIKLEKDLRDDPRVRDIAIKLQDCSVTHQALHPVTLRTLVIGGLVKLWCYADTYICDGHDTLDATLNDIDEIVGIEGFAQILPTDWLQVINPKQVKFPNYHRHNGTEAKKKAVTLDRVHKHRNSAKARNAKGVTPPKTTVTPPALPDQDLDQDLSSLGSLTSSVPDTQHSKVKAVGEIVAGPVERIFDHWRTEYARPRTVLDAKRRLKIAAAIKLGFDEATLKVAISGYKNSAHHMGQTDGTVFNDIELFLRDAQHIEAGLQFAQRGAVLPLSPVALARQKLQAIINGGNGHADVPVGCDEVESGGDLGPPVGLFR